jgi:hypothetical protein
MTFYPTVKNPREWVLKADLLGSLFVLASVSPWLGIYPHFRAPLPLAWMSGADAFGFHQMHLWQCRSKHCIDDSSIEARTNFRVPRDALEEGVVLTEFSELPELPSLFFFHSFLRVAIHPALRTGREFFAATTTQFFVVLCSRVGGIPAPNTFTPKSRRCSG